MTRIFSCLVGLYVIVVFAACGGPSAEPVTPEPPPEPAPAPPAATESPPEPDAGEATEPPPAAEVTWKDMSHEQRLAHMKTKVAPQMKASFQAFDATHFANFGCATCHGPGAKEGKFEMPNPALPKLDAKDGFKAELKKHPKETQFMMEKVAPEMAALLGMQPYDPATKEGFGCFGCHTPK